MAKKKITSAHKLEYLLMTLTVKMLKLFPYNTAESLASWLFKSIGMGFGVRKKLALQQIGEAFPQMTGKEKKRTITKMYQHFGRLSADMFLVGKLEEKKINIVGWDNITQALQLGRGLLFISGHLGNWELAGRVLAARGIPISVVIKRIHNGLVNEHINRIREANGIKIIYKTKALRPTIQAFKNNEALVTLIDQNARKNGYRLPFLGKQASLHTGFVRLAIKNDTPIVFGAALRNEDGTYDFVFEKLVIPSEFPIKRGDENAADDTIRREIEIAKYFHGRLEHYIKQCPEQWFWLHNRWKRANKAKRTEL